MDRQKLRSLVFDKTGIKIDCDDPIFALVALNEAVLADTVERQLTLLDNAARELALQAQAAAGGAPRPLPPAPQPPSAAAPSMPPAPPDAQPAPAFAPLEKRLLAAAAAIALSSALLVLAGQALFRPAAGITAQQRAAIAQGEQLALAVQKLDQKNRDLIQAELQKNP